MNDVAIQIEVLLRSNKYDTWILPLDSGSVICFEDDSVIGFVHQFPTAAQLVAEWQKSQSAALMHYALPLRTAGTKGWNVYSIFLAPDRDQSLQQAVANIEEDFSLTRKIARLGVESLDDIEAAFMHLIPVRVLATIGKDVFSQRLATRMSDISQSGVNAFLSDVPVDEVARILES